jgi:hypothetical protein
MYDAGMQAAVKREFKDEGLRRDWCDTHNLQCAIRKAMKAVPVAAVFRKVNCFARVAKKSSRYVNAATICT